MRIALVLTLLMVLGGAAEAHMVVLPERSVAGGTERYTLIVPTEGRSATVRVELRVPLGVEIGAFEAKSGWQGTHDAFPIGAATLRWSGGRIPPGQMMSFDFLAANPRKPGALTWSAVQWFEDGTSERWGEGGSPDHHASTTTLVEPGGDDAGMPHVRGDAASAPQAHGDDVAASHDQGAGEAAADAARHEHATSGAGAGAADAAAGAGSPALWVAMAALVVAVTALVVALRGGGRARV